MPRFSYKAINTSGQTINGTMEASSADAVLGMLVTQGNIPISVTAAKGTEGSASGLQALLAPVKPPEIILFTKQLRTMLRSGIPVLQIFSILAEQTKNATLRKALLAMEQEIREGATLSSVFNKQSHIFSKLYCGLISAGELSGTMVEVLDRVTYIIEHEYKVKRDIKSALAYPKMVLVTLFGAFFFLLTFVIPKFVGIFSKAGITLPLPTKICLLLYSGLKMYWPVLLGGAAAAVTAYKLIVRTEQGAIARDLFFIRLPIIGQLFVKSAMSRFASILAILLASGVSVISSFEILSATIGNAAIAKELDDLSTEMQEGKGVSEPLRKSKFFPPMVVNMIAIGEESGSLEEMLRQLAGHYDEEVEYAIAGLSEAIGPVLIVVLTAVVGFFALAIFLPMWDLTKMVK